MQILRSNRLSLGLLILSLSAQCLAGAPPITALAFDPTETELLAGSQKGVERYSWPDLKPGEMLKTNLQQIHDIAFSPDGKSLAIAGGTPGSSGELELWQWPSAQKLATYKLHSDVIYQLAWIANSKRLFTASHDGEVLEVAPSSGMITQRFVGHSQPVRALLLLPDQQTLLTAGNDQTIRVWDTKTGNLLRSLHNHTKAVHALALKPQSKDGELPIAASIGADGTLRLWQPTIGRMMRFRRLPASVPLALAWYGKGECLLVTDDKGHLHIIDSETLEIKNMITTKSHQSVSLLITKDGTTLIVGGQHGLLQKFLLN